MEKAAYRLSKITNKYLIIEIFSYTDYRDKAAQYICKSNKTFLKLVKENFKAFINLTKMFPICLDS